MKRFLLPLIIVLTGCNDIPASKTQREFKKPVLRYLHDVLIKKEFGAGNGSVVRWIESPEVIMMEGKEEHQKIFNGVVAQLNGALKQTPMQLQVTDRLTGSRTVEVFMIPQSRFAEVGKKCGFNPPKNQHGFVWVKWNTKKKYIFRATILIAVDKLKADLLQHVLLEEMTQALGPLGDTAVTSDSVMYEKGRDHGKAPKLGEWDRRMLDLLYGHLKPGDGWREVEAAFLLFWDK